MKKLFFILFLVTINLFLNDYAYNQSDKPVRLLKEWNGIWEGELGINGSDGAKSNINMSLEISETDSAGIWNWVINYGDSVTRNYLLRKIDSEKGLYILDEQNLILLDFYKFRNTLYSTFSAGNSLIISRYELDGSEIYFEIISSSMNTTNISNSKENEEMLIYSYPINVVQKAILKKK